MLSGSAAFSFVSLSLFACLTLSGSVFPVGRASDKPPARQIQPILTEEEVNLDALDVAPWDYRRWRIQSRPNQVARHPSAGRIWELKGVQPVRNLWRREDLGAFPAAFAAEVPTHSAILLKIGKPERTDYFPLNAKAP